MTDTDGIPVGLAVGGANVHDIRLLQLTSEDCFCRLGFEQAGFETPLLGQRLRFSGDTRTC
jgi:putative transposase